MTLTADEHAWRTTDERERRATAREPRRSWASAQPFERRVTPVNSDGGLLAESWRAVGAHYVRFMCALDAIVAAGVTYALLARSTDGPRAVLASLLGALLFVALVGAFRGYDRDRVGDGPTEFQAVLRAGAGVAATLVALSWLLDLPVPRQTVLLGVPLTVGVVAVVRHAGRRRVHRWRFAGQAMMRTVVIGDVATAQRVAADLHAAPHHGYEVIGVCVSDLDSVPATDVPVLGATADVVQVVVDHAADVVVVGAGHLRGEALRRLSWALGRAGAHLVVVPDLVEVAGPRLAVRPTAGLSLLEVEVGAPRRRTVAKAVLDVTLALVAGVVALPVVLAAAAVVRATSPGRAFFHQTRVGVDGRRFTMWKLRTMYVDADARLEGLRARNEGAGVLFKMRQDPRVTPVGRWLRRYSLDELPQLWNVVRGDMSLVGPRPPLEHEVQAYQDQVHRRLHVKPGLTGLWQVSGRSDLDWDESVRLDLRYVDNWSVAMDLMILWKTARAVLRSSGAY